MIKQLCRNFGGKAASLRMLVGAVSLALLATACVSSAPARETELPPESAPATAPAAKSAARQRAQDLLTGEVRPQTRAATAAAAANAAVTSPAAGTADTTPAAAPEAAANVMTDQEKQFFASFLAHLNYLVVVKDGSAINKNQASSVVSKANEHLLKAGYNVTHYEQFLKNREDQKAAFEAEAGEAMSLVQFIAQKLGADLYVELDAVPHAWTENGRHYGEAAFTVTMFDPSTADLLASVTYKTDRSISTSSPDDALLNALVAGTSQLMPRVIRDSTAVLRNRYANGIKYQLIIQKTGDPRQVAQFRRNLKLRVRDIASGPSAADQTLMDVYLFGTLSNLEDYCYAAFEKTPGLENAYTVYTRGKSITFNSGSR